MKSQIKNKKRRSILLIPILNKFISYRFLLILFKGEIMNNHHKIISLHVVLPPIVWEVFFKIFLQQFRRRVARLPIFMGKSRHWTSKLHKLRTREDFFRKQKNIETYENVSHCWTCILSKIWLDIPNFLEILQFSIETYI